MRTALQGPRSELPALGSCFGSCVGLGASPGDRGPAGAQPHSRLSGQLLCTSASPIIRSLACLPNQRHKLAVGSRGLLPVTVVAWPAGLLTSSTEPSGARWNFPRLVSLQEPRAVPNAPLSERGSCPGGGWVLPSVSAPPPWPGTLAQQALLSLPREACPGRASCPGREGTSISNVQKPQRHPRGSTDRVSQRGTQRQNRSLCAPANRFRIHLQRIIHFSRGKFQMHLYPADPLTLRFIASPSDTPSR